MYVSLLGNKCQCVCSLSTYSEGGVVLGVYPCDFHLVSSADVGRAESCGPEGQADVDWKRGLLTPDPLSRGAGLLLWGWGGCLWVPQQVPTGAGPESSLQGGAEAGGCYVSPCHLRTRACTTTGTSRRSSTCWRRTGTSGRSCRPPTPRTSRCGCGRAWGEGGRGRCSSHSPLL